MKETLLQTLKLFGITDKTYEDVVREFKSFTQLATYLDGITDEDAMVVRIMAHLPEYLTTLGERLLSTPTSKSGLLTPRKYEFTGETQSFQGHTLRRIRAVRDFDLVYAGTLGGWIEKEENLSHEGTAWVAGEARVYEDARIYGNAQVCGSALIYGNAQVYGDARVYGYAIIEEEAWIFGDATICEHAEVYGKARVYGHSKVCGDAKVFDSARVYGGAIVHGGARIYGDTQLVECMSIWEGW